MALDLDELFTDIGRFGRVLFLLDTGQASLPAGFTSLYGETLIAYPAELSGTTAQQQAAIRGLSSFYSTLQQSAQQLIISAVKADVPPAGTSLSLALTEVRRQMIAQSKTVETCVVGISSAQITGFVGTGALVTSTKRGDGLSQEHIVAEAARLACTQDSYSGGATVGQEQFTFTGAPNSAGVFDYDWPQGSAATASLTAVSSDTDASTTSNLLTNGDMEDWTTDATPELNYWELDTGAWGTDIQRSATGLRGSYSLQFIHGTATLTGIATQFDSSSVTGTDAGTPADPATQTSYAVNMWLRTVSGTAGAGVMTVALIDGGGTVINDAQGVANSFTIDLTALTTAWAARSGVFRLPIVRPAVVRLRLKITTALTTVGVLVDDVCYAPLSQPYPGGPGLAIFSGATPFVLSDTWTVTTTNDRGGATYGATFQTLFLRLFSNPALLLPSDAAPNEADTLITNA